VVLKIVAGGGPIWTAWPILVSHRTSTSAAPLLLPFVALYLTSLRSIPITLCRIYGCLLLVDLAETPFISFCCSPEAWDGSLLRFSPPFVKTRFVTSNRWRDLHWPWMFSWQWIWGLLPLRAFLVYPLGDLRVDLAKLFLVESPNRIAWHLMLWTIRFTSFVTVCSDGILAPSLLPPRTSPVDATLPSYWIVIKSSSVCCICFCIFAFLLLCLVFLYCCLCCPLCRVLYYDVCHFCLFYSSKLPFFFFFFFLTFVEALSKICYLCFHPLLLLHVFFIFLISLKPILHNFHLSSLSPLSLHIFFFFFNLFS
jgi:hypothetical protein